ncbi:MAG: hypothetical protein RLZZ502_1538 [Pseudomonadota bacterium]|jgi:CBS domain-containing protein
MQVSEILRIKGNRLFVLAPEASMETAIALMAREDVGSILVAQGTQLLGLLTFREVLRHQAQHGSGATLIAEVMDATPFTTSPEVDIMSLRAAMLHNHARYVPVNADGKLIGVLSFHDVAKAVISAQDLENEALKNYINDVPALRA